MEKNGSAPNDTQSTKNGVTSLGRNTYYRHIPFIDLNTTVQQTALQSLLHCLLAMVGPEHCRRPWFTQRSDNHYKKTSPYLRVI